MQAHQQPEMCGASSWNYNRPGPTNNSESCGEDEDVDGQSEG